MVVSVILPLGCFWEAQALIFKELEMYFLKKYSLSKQPNGLKMNPPGEMDLIISHGEVIYCTDSGQNDLYSLMDKQIFMAKNLPVNTRK